MSAILTLTVGVQSIAVTESILKTVYVDIIALENLVAAIATVLLVSLVVMLMTNVQQLVLENPAPIVSTVLPGNVVMLMANAQQLVLGNRVPMMATVHRANVVILITNVKQETVM